MKSVLQSIIPLLSVAWRRHGKVVRLLGVLVLAITAIGRTIYALPRLLHDIEPWSALDLKYRFTEVSEWFAGNPVYGVVDGAVYPPASHVILWPFMGWLALDGARVIWAITTLGAAFLLAWMLYRHAGVPTLRDRLLLAGLALGTYALQICLFVGQMGMHVGAFAVGGAILLIAWPVSWWRDLLAGSLLACALVKPTLSLPIIVAALIVTGRVRPVGMLIGAYGALTLVAGFFQPDNLFTLFRDWLEVAGWRVPIEDGVPNLHLLMLRLGVDEWMTPASMVLLAFVGAWMWRYRAADPWLLLGIAGLVARFWAHSTLYDDALLLLPALALFRMSFLAEGARHVAAGWFFTAAWIAILTPTWAYYGMGATVLTLLHVSQAALWLAVLTFLAWVATDRRTTMDMHSRTQVET